MVFLPIGVADDLVISGDQIITIDSDYTQAGDILIQDSGSLIVKNGATLTASGYDITVKGKGTLKTEEGALKANKVSLYDDAKLDMTQNSKLELSDFGAENQASITIKNAKISTGSFDTSCKNIELSSGEIISSSSVSINVQSLSVADSTMKGSPISIESPSTVSIKTSVIDGISIISCPSIYISEDSKVAVVSIDSSKVNITNSEINRVASIKANDFSVSYNSKILGGESLNIDSFKGFISDSEICSDHGADSSSHDIAGGDSSLSISSDSTLSIINSEISSGNGGDVRSVHPSGSRWGSSNNGGDSSLSITSESSLSISNSKINGGNGGEGDRGCDGGDGGDGGGSSLSITSKSSVSISNSKIKGGNGGEGGLGGYKSPSYFGGPRYKGESGDSGDSSLSISTDSSLSISNSEINSGKGGAGYWKPGIDEGQSFLSITFQELTAVDTIFNKPLDCFKDSRAAYLTNVSAPSITAKDSAIVNKYLYITAKVTDKLGTPVGNANVDVLYYLNETTYKSETTDSSGIAKIPVLSNIITSQGDKFVGNYKVIADYQDYTTSKTGVEMKGNRNINLDFSELVIPKAQQVHDATPSVREVGDSDEGDDGAGKTKPKSTPAFEAIFAIAGLLAIAYLLRRWR